MTTKKRRRRTDEELVQDLQKKIGLLKKRAQAKKAKSSPAMKHMAVAVRSVDLALESAESASHKGALIAAREPLVAFLQMDGVMIPKRRGRKPRAVAPPSMPRGFGQSEDASGEARGRKASETV